MMRFFEIAEGTTNYCTIEGLESRLLLSGTAYVVDSLLDVVADDGVVTLREAMEVGLLAVVK